MRCTYEYGWIVLRDKGHADQMIYTNKPLVLAPF